MDVHLIHQPPLSSASGQTSQDYYELLRQRALESRAETYANSARTITAAICLSLAAMGIALVGLAFNLFGGGDWLLLTGRVEMLPAPAGCLVGIGLALLLQCYDGARFKVVRVFSYLIAVAVVVFAAAVLTKELSEPFAWWQTLSSGNDTFSLLFDNAAMHPLQAFGYILFGLAICGLDVEWSKGRRIAEYVAPVLMVLATMLLLGYMYGVASMTRMGYEKPVPLLIAVAFLSLGAALLMARPRYRLMAIITRHAPGGEMLRRSLPQMLTLLIALDWLVDVLLRKVLHTSELSAPVLTLINSVILLVIIWRVADRVDREYGARQQSAAELAEASALLIALSDNTDDPMFVKDLAGRLIFANPAALRQFGQTWDGAKQRTNEQLYADPETAVQSSQVDYQVMQTRQAVTSEEVFNVNGAAIVFHVTKAPWIDSGGNIKGVVGVSTDITDRKETEDSLRRRELELERTVAERTALLRDLTNHIETVREEEKRAIARELHDDMGASLTALSMHLEGVYKALPGETPWPDRQARIRKLLASLVATTRRIQTELRPNMLDLFGLNAAITEQVEEFALRTGTECKTSLPDDHIKVDHKIEIAVFRMMQEALNNVAKHAKATQVQVILDIDEDQVALTVRDNGTGIAAGRIDNTMTHGLRGMRERASYLGGNVRFKSVDGQGTTVTIEIPLNMM